MNTLIFATNNEHKVLEIRHKLDGVFDIMSLKEAGILIDIPEPHDTLEANAYEKSHTIFSHFGKNCFSEDTGLEVDELDGAPGVNSARYAGDGRNFDANIDKLLFEMMEKSNRKARFRTIISLILDDKVYSFEGVCPGQILLARQGRGGFGYDAIFLPEGSSKSFGEMTMSEKQTYSHRAKAVDALISFLKNDEGVCNYNLI